MGMWGDDKVFKIFYWPNPNKYHGTELLYKRVAIVTALTRSEAIFAFQKQYVGEYHTIDHVEEM